MRPRHLRTHIKVKGTDIVIALSHHVSVVMCFVHIIIIIIISIDVQ